MKRTIIIFGACILLSFLVACQSTQTTNEETNINGDYKKSDYCPDCYECWNKQIVRDPTLCSEESIETLSIPCNGPAGESFYLFDGAESYDIIRTKKLNCVSPVEVLERKCIQNVGSYEGDMYEVDKVRQGSLIGWAQRKDLTCKNIYCEVAPDSICG